MKDKKPQKPNISEAVPFDDALRRLVSAPPQHKRNTKPKRTSRAKPQKKETPAD